MTTNLYDPPVYSDRLKRRMALAEEIIMLVRKIDMPNVTDEERDELQRTLVYRINGYSFCVGEWRNDVDGDLLL